MEMKQEQVDAIGVKWVVKHVFLLVVLGVGLPWKVEKDETDWLFGLLSDFVEKVDFVNEAVKHIK